MTTHREFDRPSTPLSDRPGKSAARRLGAALLEALLAGLLIALVALIFVGVVMRYFFNMPLSFGDELASFMFLWFVMLSAVLAMDRHEHLRLSIAVDLLPPRVASFVNVLGMLIIAVFILALTPEAFRYARAESFIVSPGLDISEGWRAAALPVGFALMALIVCDEIIKADYKLDILFGALVVGAFIVLMLFLRPALLDLGTENIFIFLVGVLLFCLCIGIPIAFCFGAAVLSFLSFSTSLPLSVIVGRMNEGMSGFILLSVPIFVLLGCILDATGMGKAIVNVLGSCFGHVRAGMSYVLLGSLYLVSGISGSKVSDMATVAPALFPEMKRRGNNPSEMVSLMATGAIMADTVPPSIMLIVMGSVVGISIASLFISGFVVAFWLLLLLAAAARWKARREDMRGVKRATFATMGRALLFAAPALALPFLIRSAVTEGVATATEVSTVAVAYAFVIGSWLYGGISLRKAYEMLVETAAMSGAIMLIMGTAAAAAWALTQTGFSQILTDFVTDLPGGWVSFMIVTILTFVTLGCMLEGLPAIVLLAPLMFPIARSLGIHDVHYAMVIIVSVNIGMFIPPIGIGFYIACSIGKVAPREALGFVWFYLGALIVGLILIALVPALTIGVL
ncbi:MAG: TRAP transporter large permease subunit [Rhizobiaceae bacterium]